MMLLGTVVRKLMRQYLVNERHFEKPVILSEKLEILSKSKIKGDLKARGDH